MACVGGEGDETLLLEATRGGEGDTAGVTEAPTFVWLSTPVKEKEAEELKMVLRVGPGDPDPVPSTFEAVKL